VKKLGILKAYSKYTFIVIGFAIVFTLGLVISVYALSLARLKMTLYVYFTCVYAK
jgi:hypothetical protein